MPTRGPGGRRTHCPPSRIPQKTCRPSVVRVRTASQCKIVDMSTRSDSRPGTGTWQLAWTAVPQAPQMFQSGNGGGAWHPEGSGARAPSELVPAGQPGPGHHPERLLVRHVPETHGGDEIHPLGQGLGGGGHRNGRGITVNHKPGPGTAAHFPECHGIAEPSHLMQPCPPGCWVEHAEPAGKNARWVSVRGKNGDCPPGCAQGKRYLPSSLQASFWTITAVNWKRNREPTPYFSVGGR